MFKDPDRTDFPSNIYVRFEESGEARKTSVSAFVDRKSFENNGSEYNNGDGIFSAVNFLVI